MNRQVTTVIDHQRCNGCGLFVAVCPKDTISLQDGLAQVTGNESLNCGHCAAVCPQKAIHVGGIDTDLSSYSTVTTSEAWLPFGAFDTGKLVQLMRSRRSCRNYIEKPVERHVLEDLVKIGITAPSGSNCQPWSFTILPDRKSVLELGNQIKIFFKKTNRFVGLSDDETPYAVIALGYPDESSTSVTGRCRVKIRYFNPKR